MSAAKGSRKITGQEMPARSLTKMRAKLHHPNAMFLKRSGRVVPAILAVTLLLFFMPRNSGAQSVDVFVGVRGGFTSSSSPLEGGSNHYFPPTYTSSYSPTAWGPSVGVIVNDKFEIRAEAAKYRFHYRGQSGTPYPASLSKSTWVTDGHAWQFPVLVSYRLKVGSFRTFFGGGIGTRSVKGTVTATTTTIQPSNPTETTTVSTYAYKPVDSRSKHPLALYYGIGFEFRKGWISLRPEMRFAIWTGYQADSENQVVGSPTQAEFIVGIWMHPFPKLLEVSIRKSRDYFSLRARLSCLQTAS
jgi:hypothetical protein